MSSISENTGRSHRNRISFLITCSVLLLTFALADGNFTKRINEIGKSLDRAIIEMLELEKTNYTEFDDNVTYYSSTQFNPKGMGGLYNLSRAFMKLLQPEGQLYPEGECSSSKIVVYLYTVFIFVLWLLFNVTNLFVLHFVFQNFFLCFLVNYNRFTNKAVIVG